MSCANLHYSEAPTSFTQQAMYKIARSSNLWPSENGHVRSFLPACRRLVERIICGIAMSILVAPVGVVYHSLQALGYRVQVFNPYMKDSERSRAYAFAAEHTKAVVLDALGMVGGGLYYAIVNPGEGSSFFASSSDVFVDQIDYHGLFEISQKKQQHYKWSQCLCKYQVLQVYSLEILFQASILQWNKQGDQCQLNDSRVLHAIHMEAWDYPDKMTPSFFPTMPSWNHKEEVYVRGKNDLQPVYPFPKRALVLAISGVVIIVFNSIAALYLSKSLLLTNPDRYLKIIGIFYLLGVTLLRAASFAYTQNQGQTEYDLALSLIEQNRSRAEISHWLHKAARRGHHVSQRLYGLAQIASLPLELPIEDEAKRNYIRCAKKGLEWMMAAAQNEEQDVREAGIHKSFKDLEALFFPNQESLNHSPDWNGMLPRGLEGGNKDPKKIDRELLEYQNLLASTQNLGQWKNIAEKLIRDSEPNKAEQIISIFAEN